MPYCIFTLVLFFIYFFKFVFCSMKHNFLHLRLNLFKSHFSLVFWVFSCNVDLSAHTGGLYVSLVQFAIAFADYH